VINLLALRTTLEAALEPHLGIYTFSTGDTTPAVKIEDGSIAESEQPSVEGLELVIIESPEIPFSAVMGGYREMYTALIILKQWDIAATTLEARSPLLQALMGMDNLLVSGGKRVVRTSRLDNIETLTVQVSQSFLVEEAIDYLD
jgi:hypothetical protein